MIRSLLVLSIASALAACSGGGKTSAETPAPSESPAVAIQDPYTPVSSDIPAYAYADPVVAQLMTELSSKRARDGAGVLRQSTAQDARAEKALAYLLTHGTGDPTESLVIYGVGNTPADCLRSASKIAGSEALMFGRWLEAGAAMRDSRCAIAFVDAFPAQQLAELETPAMTSNVVAGARMASVFASELIAAGFAPADGRIGSPIVLMARTAKSQLLANAAITEVSLRDGAGAPVPVHVLTRAVSCGPVQCAPLAVAPEGAVVIVPAVGLVAGQQYVARIVVSADGVTIARDRILTVIEDPLYVQPGPSAPMTPPAEPPAPPPATPPATPPGGGNGGQTPPGQGVTWSPVLTESVASSYVAGTPTADAFDLLGAIRHTAGSGYLVHDAGQQAYASSALSAWSYDGTLTPTWPAPGFTRTALVGAWGDDVALCVRGLLAQTDFAGALLGGWHNVSVDVGMRQSYAVRADAISTPCVAALMRADADWAPPRLALTMPVLPSTVPAALRGVPALPETALYGLGVSPVSTIGHPLTFGLRTAWTPNPAAVQVLEASLSYAGAPVASHVIVRAPTPSCAVGLSCASVAQSGESPHVSIVPAAALVSGRTYTATLRVSVDGREMTRTHEVVVQ
jgi:hypothetical protein